MIFQFLNLLEDLTVTDNVLLPAQLAGTPRSQARASCGQLLARLGIASQHGHCRRPRLRLAFVPKRGRPEANPG